MSDDPTERKPRQPIYNNPYDLGNPYYNDTSIPTPPPSDRKRRSLLLVAVMLVVVAAMAGFTFVKLNSMSVSPTPTPTIHLTAPSNNGRTDLYSQNFNAFYGAFTQAMSTGQYDLGSTISQAYKLVCDPSPTPSCSYDWLNTYHMLTGGHLGFSFPYNATYTNDSCNNIAYPVRAFTYTVVQYTQDGAIKAPTSGDAVLIFSLSSIGENTSQWYWEGVILQSSC